MAICLDNNGKDSSGIKAYFALLGTWVPVSILLIWAVLLPRMIPSLNNVDIMPDRGIFVSVAERILAGDVLYQNVWDNKDPLFYLSLALGRALSPYMDIFIEVLWMAWSGLAMLVLARRLGCNFPSALFVGFGMTPLILTGAFYHPGYTPLPGITLTLLIFASVVSQRFAIAGVLLALLVFFKIVMLPVVLLLLALVVTIRRTWRGIGPAATAFVLSSAAVLILLWARGELKPYLTMLVLNVAYSQGSLVQSQRWGGPIVEHLRLAMPMGGFSIVLAVSSVLTWEFAARRAGRVTHLHRQDVIIWACTAGSLLGGLIVLGLTGLWDHHAQILYIPAVLAGLLVVHRSQSMFTVKSLASVLAFTCLAMLFAGSPHSSMYIEPILGVRQALASLTEISPEAHGLLSVGPGGTYARVGANDDHGHAYGSGNWKLVCPRFHQYPFESQQILSKVVECLPTAEAIIVSPSAVKKLGNAIWNEYLDQVELLLRTQYSCTEWQAERICVRVNVNNNASKGIS